MLGLILCLIWLYAALRTVLLVAWLAGTGVRWLARCVILRAPAAMARSLEPRRVSLTDRERLRRREALLSDGKAHIHAAI
jgi:hypothetical protein